MEAMILFYNLKMADQFHFAVNLAEIVFKRLDDFLFDKQKKPPGKRYLHGGCLCRSFGRWTINLRPKAYKFLIKT
jgi:hypothetical protein